MKGGTSKSSRELPRVKKTNDFQCSQSVSHRQRRPRTTGLHNYKSLVYFYCCHSLEVESKILITAMHLIGHMYALTIPLKRRKKHGWGTRGLCMLSILKVLSSIPSTQHPQNNVKIQINIKYTPFTLFSFIFPPISFFHPITPPFLCFSISYGGHRELLSLYDQVQTCSMLDMAILD